MALGVSFDLELMRASVLLESDPAAAARCASAILESSPGNEEANLLLATARRRLGDPETAVRLLEPLVHTQPGSATLQLELAKAYAVGNRREQAMAAVLAALAVDDQLAEAWRVLAAQRFIGGDLVGGDFAYAQFIRLAPLPPELTDAAHAIVTRQLDAAEELLRRQLKSTPDHVEAMRMLATVVSTLGNFVEAEKLLNRCLELAPGFAEARFDLANEILAQQRHAEVLLLVERLLAADPANTSYMSVKAQALRLAGRHADALAQMQQAISAEPESAKLRLLHGHLLRELGEQARALEAYRCALTIKPGMGEAYWSLGNLKTVKFEDVDLQMMQQQLARSAPNDASRIHLEFALGKAFEDLGNYESSFEHYARGNGLERSKYFYDPDDLSAAMQRSRAMLTAQFFAARRDWGSECNDPIFVVGVPRSGSTLLEQILASHSQIEGTRELLTLPAIVQDVVLRENPEDKERYPGAVGRLERAQVEAYAAQYLRQTAEYRTLGKPRFVDKMLGNFAHIGLIHLMFPRATIIDARRHPLGCGFSCFKQLFGRGQPFTYDQGELGRYLRDYFEFMEHVDAVLPGRVHRVYYEQLVGDPESVVRRLLDHCGLPFEAGCLKFYENRRAVTTISSEQVRRPIHADAVDHWRHFEPWLGRLRAAVGDMVERYPAYPPSQP